MSEVHKLLVNVAVVAVADGHFGLCGSERADGLFTSSPPFPVSDKPHGFRGR